MQVCELTELVNQSIEFNQPVAEQANITIDFSETAPVYAYVDTDRFIQVMTNLFSNAIKFSPEGGIIATRVKKSANEIEISVTDQGIGIAEAFHSQIFNKFAQADSSDTRKYGGTGLGLSIVKFIIEQFNGWVDFISLPGEKTTFYLHLPVTDKI